MSGSALVTGGAGFIGSTLVDRLLAEGWRVDVVDDLSTGSLANLAGARNASDRRFSFHRLDITDGALADLVAQRKPEVVFHLAAQIDVRVSVARPAADALVNVVGSLHVFEAALAAGVGKVVFAGSGGTLYGTPAVIPTPETEPHRPESPYGVAKKAVGDYLHYYRQERGLDATVLALANVYGSRQDPHGEAGVVAIFAGRLLAREPVTIFGDGAQTRDFVFVEDVADAFVRAVDRAGGLTCNIGTGIETSVAELHSVMAALAGAPASVHHAPARAGEVPRSALDPTRAGTHLGWSPFTTLEEGLALTLEHFRARA